MPAGNAVADIYKNINANGQTTYTNIKTTGGTNVLRSRIIASTPNASAAPPTNTPKQTPTPTAFPKINQQTQTQRDDQRATILNHELLSEKSALALANQAQSHGNPSATDDITNHQRNIGLLQKELNGHR